MGSCRELETGLPSITQRVTKLQNCKAAPHLFCYVPPAIRWRSSGKIVLGCLSNDIYDEIFGLSVRFNWPKLQSVREGLRRL
jgi:hypothetical protein